MPTNKNALTRYKYLDELLSDRHHYYDIHDLTEKCNQRLVEDGFPEVTQRCIEKDINYIEYAPFSADIERFRVNGKRCLRYENPSFSIFRKELTEEEWNVVQQVMDEALQHLIDFRKQEGAALQHKFAEKLDNIQRLLTDIEPYEKGRVEKIRARIIDGLQAIPEVDYDKNRLEQELIYYIEKLDISEEKQRLNNHLKYFRETMESE